MSAREVLHQMRPFPPVWTRPIDDRPPYGIWPIAATGVVTVICTLLHPTHPHIWVLRRLVCRSDRRVRDPLHLPEVIMSAREVLHGMPRSR